MSKATMESFREVIKENSLLNDEQSEDTPQLADLIVEIEETVLRYVELEQPTLATLLALWIVQSYELAMFGFCGILSLQSASPRCGKSRLLEILGCFTREIIPLRTMPTPAVLYRTKDQTLFLDEIESLKNSDKEKYGEIMALLNMSFKRGGLVERVEKLKNEWVVKKYSCYRAIALAGLNNLSEAIADRSFRARMKRTSRKMPRLNVGKLENEMQRVRSGLTLWWQVNGDDVREVYENLPDEPSQLKKLDDRLMDISEPLLVLAQCADAEKGSDSRVMVKFLEAVKMVSSRRSPSGVEESLIRFIDTIKPKLADTLNVFVPSHELVDLCRKTDGLEWIETPRRLNGFLKKFDLFPKSQGGKIRGYNISREWIDEWRTRYA